MVAASQLVAALFIVATLLVHSSAWSFTLLFLACITAEAAPEPAASIVQVGLSHCQPQNCPKASFIKLASTNICLVQNDFSERRTLLPSTENVCMAPNSFSQHRIFLLSKECFCSTNMGHLPKYHVVYIGFGWSPVMSLL